jgi:hypothetical protein
MSNQSSTTTTINTPKEELNQIMVEMFMMIEEMDIQEGKYLEFAEMFKSMNLNIDRLAGMRQQIIVNTYYQRYVRPQQTVRHHRLTEAEKEKNADYTLCNCGRYVSNVTPKFALKHLNTAVHYQGVRNRKYAHTTFNNEEINAKIKTEVVLQCFIIKHLSEVIKRTAEAIRIQEEEEEANRVQRELDEEEDTGEIYIGRPTVQMGLDMLREFDSDEEDEKAELSVAEEDEKADEEEELSVAEEFRQGLLEPEEEELSTAETMDEIKFKYESRCKGVGVYRQYEGVIEKITKKTMTIGGHIYKKEKMMNVRMLEQL